MTWMKWANMDNDNQAKVGDSGQRLKAISVSTDGYRSTDQLYKQNGELLSSEVRVNDSLVFDSYESMCITSAITVTPSKI